MMSAMVSKRRLPHGVPPVRCSARSKGTGKRCRRYATVGSTTCYHHGGYAPQVIDRAEQRIIQQQLEELAGERQDLGDIAAALHGAKTVARIGALEASMGVDDQLARNLQLEGDLVGAAISAGLDWLSGALDGETAVRVRIGLLQRAHEALVALEDPDTPLPDTAPPGFKLALVEQLPRELESAPEPTRLADVSDDDLETEVIRRLRERGEVA
jgi:hypothetical protein